jgi:hypothetical protein
VRRTITQREFLAAGLRMPMDEISKDASRRLE